MTPALEAWATPLREQVDHLILSRFSDTWPSLFGKACAYPIQTGGKRFRALLTLAASEALGQAGPSPALFSVAAAIECVHTYSLVHDDLPSMDDDAERRGKPTVHMVYGEGAAILVGDSLLTESFAILADSGLRADQIVALVAELSRAAGQHGMVGGQATDIGMAGSVEDLAKLMRLHRGKTGALIQAAVRMGGIAGGASADQLAALTTYGSAVGLAFQMADDVLDAEEDAAADGPPSYVKLLGEPETKRQARALMNEALEAIAGLASPQMLAAMARFTVERNH